MEIKVSDLPSVCVDVHPLHVNPNGPIDAIGSGLILQRASSFNSEVVEIILHDRETGERKQITITLAQRKASARRHHTEPSKVSEETSETPKKATAGPAAPLSPKASPAPQPVKKVAPAPNLGHGGAAPKKAPAAAENVVQSLPTVAPKSPSPSPKPFKGVLKK